MPTQNPRITITLRPATHAQLQALSRLTGNSQSALVGDLLSQASPVFEKMILVLDAAHRVKGSINEKIISDLADSQQRVESQLGLVLDDLDAATAPILELAEKVSRRGTRAKATPRTGTAPRHRFTPISNRGVRTAQVIDNKGKQKKSTEAKK
jgi:hypothetical protein